MTNEEGARIGALLETIKQLKKEAFTRTHWKAEADTIVGFLREIEMETIEYVEADGRAVRAAQRREKNRRADGKFGARR